MLYIYCYHASYLNTIMEKKNDNIFKFFEDLGDNKMDDIKYKESLLANLYSQVEFLKEEMKEKNYIIRNLLKRIKSNNCDILLKLITNDKESYVETSSEFTTGNEDQNLVINLNDNINNQSEGNSNNSQLDNSIGSNVSPDEISINEQHNE